MYPNDMFVFVYDLSSTVDKKAGSLISDRWEWNLWLKTYSTVLSTFDYSLLLGKAWIDKGYAIADHNSEVINHEWAHLETCKIHGPHTDEGNPATWQPFFSKNETRPWCAGRAPNHIIKGQYCSLSWNRVSTISLRPALRAF
ncbi:MAG TPA: hypothetical protein VFA15_09470, partial [Nitrososphaera sp.]|nr:hypothetical protein [Nitrososphaera sp.]